MIRFFSHALEDALLQARVTPQIYPQHHHYSMQLTQQIHSHSQLMATLVNLKVSSHPQAFEMSQESLTAVHKRLASDLLVSNPVNYTLLVQP